MTYFNYIEAFIKTLRDKYQNGHAVFLSSISFKKTQSQDKLDENIVDDPNKIINLSDRDQIL